MNTMTSYFKLSPKALLLMAAINIPLSVFGEITVHGDIYGGGEIAKVGGNTKVHIKAGTIGGNIYGGGNGLLDNHGEVESSADVYGNTSVSIEKAQYKDAITKHFIYGGGNSACKVGTYTSGQNGQLILTDGTGTTNVTIGTGIGQKQTTVYGGGKGTNTSAANSIVTINPFPANAAGDNALYGLEDVFGGGDAGVIHTLAQVDIKGGTILGNLFGGGNCASVGTIEPTDFSATDGTQISMDNGNAKIYGDIFGGGNQASVIGKTSINIKSGSYAGNIYGGGNGLLLDNNSIYKSADIIGYTQIVIQGGRIFQNLDQEGNDLSAHNVFGGGNLACTVEGNTFVQIGYNNRTKTTGLATLSEQDFSAMQTTLFQDRTTPRYSYFGGGYGKNTIVKGDTYVDFAPKGTNLVYAFDIIGGGYNGEVFNNTNVHVGANAVTRDVYGGSYYGNVSGKACTVITAGTMENVYGGSLMGNIGETDIQVGFQQNESRQDEKNLIRYEYRDAVSDNSILRIQGDLYGGNDVSGEVGTVNLVLHGGKIMGSLYGAGNGNHLGYYDASKRVYQAGENDNYTQDGTYKFRPRTDVVNIDIAGNSENDKIEIYTRLFGGGNSCTVKNNKNAVSYPGLTLNMNSHVKVGHIDYTQRVNTSGFFMGNNGENLFAEDKLAEANISTQAQLDTYMENVLMNCPINLNIDNDDNTDNLNKVEDIWFANFVGGGFKGSMQKYRDNNFYYDLPKGLTVSLNIIGGCYDAIGKIEGTNLQYIGGMLGGDPGAVLQSYIESLAGGLPTSDNYKLNKWKLARRDRKALIRLNLNCEVEPKMSSSICLGGNIYGGCYNSGLVYGDVWVGNSVQPTQATDAELRELSSTSLALAQLLDDQHYCLRTYGGGYGEMTEVYGNVYVDIEDDYDITDAEGNVIQERSKAVPYAFNVFGGSDMGTVFGDTHVDFFGNNGGQVIGNLYGGGLKGDILSSALSTPRLAIPNGSFISYGQTYVRMGAGRIVKMYGGSRMANIDGGTRVNIQDDGSNNTIVAQVYGGNDISGEIRGLCPIYNPGSLSDYFKEAMLTVAQTPYGNNTFPGVSCNVTINADDASAGYPIIGQLYGAGDGSQTSSNETHWPNVTSALLQVDGGSIGQAFGGGNNATVTGQNFIYTNLYSQKLATYTVSEQMGDEGIRLASLYLSGAPSDMYNLEGRIFRFNYNIGKLFGGNRSADMAIQPRWELVNGKIKTVYSGGDRGRMTTPNGLVISIDSKDIQIDELYGGGRMADVIALTSANPDVEVVPADPENFFGTTVNISDGNIQHVYGGNDIAGSVYNGANLNVTGGILTNLYGGGNGNYVYRAKGSVVEEASDLPNVFNVPDNKGSKLASINFYRPNVEKVRMRIAGADIDHRVVVKGNTYCGGNSATINKSAHLEIGSNILLNAIYLGNNGENLVNQSYADAIALRNGIDLTDNANLAQFMEAVETEVAPTFYCPKEVSEAYVGTFCCGGNRGSMTTSKGLKIDLPAKLTIFDKVIGGCNNADFHYGESAFYEGGFTSPLADGEKNKIELNVHSHFLPRKMNYRNNSDFFDTRLIGTGESAYYDETCNIIGGCYSTGKMVGNITIRNYADLLEDLNKVGDPSNPTMTSEEKMACLERTNIKNETELIPAFSVYGAGYGAETYVLGDVCVEQLRSDIHYIKRINGIDQKVSAEDYVENDNVAEVASCNNLFGGGCRGNLVGTSTVNLFNGKVYNDMVGGSYSGILYGSTQLIVGYPKLYRCTKKGEYKLHRSNTSDEDLARVNWYNNDEGWTTQQAIKSSIWLREGEAINVSMYDAIKQKDAAQTAYFQEEVYTPEDWNHIDILVRTGVYGGGYASQSMTQTKTVNYTVKKFTDDYHQAADENDGLGYKDYGGNSCIHVADQITAANWSSIANKKEHIEISTSTITHVDASDMNSDAFGYYYMIQKVDVNGKQIDTYTPASGEIQEGGNYCKISGEGGIFGDGHMSYVEGFRSADVEGYGYAEHTPSWPKMLNTFQRLDLLRLHDCCISVFGDRDFTTLDPALYSISRIGELVLNSSINGNNDYADNTNLNSRNCLNLYNKSLYLGAITSDEDFNDIYHDANGIILSPDTSYRLFKQEKLKLELGDPQRQTRNVATARNLIRLNNAFGQELSVQYALVAQPEGEEERHYGPITGVVQIDLLGAQIDLGGGYVYANNIHATSDTKDELEITGNFVFPSDYGEEKRHIVDDCYGSPDYNKPHNKEAHRWFVEGERIIVAQKILCYTYDNEIKYFDTRNSALYAGNSEIVLDGIPEGNRVLFSRVECITNHNRGYDCDLTAADNVVKNRDRNADFEMANALIDGTKPPYKLQMCLSSNHQYNSDVQGDIVINRTFDNDNDPFTLITPNAESRIYFRLMDNVNNNGYMNEEDNYHTKHLSEEDLFIVDVQAFNQEDIPNYYKIYLTVQYIASPIFQGNLETKCAMPGEYFLVDTKDVKMKRAQNWERTVHWLYYPAGQTTGVRLENLKDPLKTEIAIPAYYFENGGRVHMANTFKNFPDVMEVTAPLDEEGNEQTVTIHNYHDMSQITKYNLQPSAGARIYIRDKEGWNAFVSYANARSVATGSAKISNVANDGSPVNPQFCEGLKFYLQCNLDLTNDFTAVSTLFKGQLNGDGHVIQIPEGKTLFSAQAGNAGLKGEAAKAYNLVVKGGNTGLREENCLQVAASGNGDNVLYGKRAYQLSHYYKEDSDYIQNDRFAGEDWKYAEAFDPEADNYHKDPRYLRTGEPNYQNYETHHVHKEVSTCDHDYRFFGQRLNKTASQYNAYPVHLDDDYLGDGSSYADDQWQETNRVYGAKGYYRTEAGNDLNAQSDNGFFYNKVAWVLNPKTMAVSWIDSELEKPAPALTSFGVDAANVTHNLLVYDGGYSATSFTTETDNSLEEDILYHHIDHNVQIENLHLVDKHDFWAPVPFTVNNRIWYERKPAYYAESNNSAWEGICLPFTAKKVFAHRGENDLLSHFYGSSNDNAIKHEYWLRCLSKVDRKNGETIAQFLRPGTSVVADSPAFEQGTLNFSNSYLAALYTSAGANYEANSIYVNPDSHTAKVTDYAEYPYLTQDIPYLIAFPGKRFYEFDLSGQWDGNNYSGAQTITFENNQTLNGGAIEIAATGEMNSAANSYKHVGTFIRSASPYGIQEDNNELRTYFDDEVATTLPFRTYLATVTNGAAPHRILIGHAEEGIEEKEDEAYKDESELEISLQGLELHIESPRACRLPLYRSNGTLVDMLTIQPGSNTYTLPNRGIYMIARCKVVAY